MSAPSSSAAKPPQKISDEKRAEIGVEGFYNIDKRRFVAMTDRAITQAKKKDPTIIYDETYGLVSNDQDAIEKFIELNDLVELSKESVQAAIDSKAKPTSAKSSSSASKVAPSSTEFIQKVKTMLENMKNPAKFLNISTLREVNAGKKDLVYNNGKRIAARKQDAQLFAQVSVQLGGSPSGGLGQPVGLDEPDVSGSSVEPPSSASRRIKSGLQLGKRVFGTASALASVSEKANAEPTPVAPVQVPEDDENDGNEEEEKNGGESEPAATSAASSVQVAPPVASVSTSSASASTSSASTSSASAPPAVVPKKLEIISRPSTVRPLIKPGALPFASKPPLMTSFTLSKPSVS
jgi:hypothetical protein